MDPFVVISFGKKVFRTRVIRHHLNPTWDEKMIFHVKRNESSYTLQFSVLDWDKVGCHTITGMIAEYRSLATTWWDLARYRSAI